MGYFDMKYFDNVKECLDYIRMEFPATLDDDLEELDGGQDKIDDVSAVLDAIKVLPQRELDTVLAALRYWQRNTSNQFRHDDPIAVDSGMYLLDCEIDELCERLNS